MGTSVAGLPEVISIHSTREGGDADNEADARLIGISIHSTREGGDNFSARFNII